jgi:hypothetical protein
MASRRDLESGTATAVFASTFLVEATSPVVSILTRASVPAVGVRKDATLKLSWLPVVLAVLLAPGCAIVQLGVTNPIPGLSTVAVAPFLNLSAERATDGRRFALAYATELQKVPGFEVVPVGVTETAMVDAKVDLNDVDDVLKLAKVLRVDAVVVGAITDYSPYYPPRIGLQVNWYSPRAWAFYPGIQTEPATRQQLYNWDQQQIDNYHENQRRVLDANAPETPFWQRAYNCFKTWPGIRTLYGEPTLALNGPLGYGGSLTNSNFGCGPLDSSSPLGYRAFPANGGPLVWRAQSPLEVDSPYGGSQPLGADGEPSGPLTKIAHYQEGNATQEIVPTGLSSSIPTLQSDQSQKLVPVPRGGADGTDDDPDGDDLDGPDGKSSKRSHPVPPPPAPAHSLRTPAERGLGSFRDGSGEMFNEPFGSEGSPVPPVPGILGPGAMPLSMDNGPPKAAVRNPCTAPPQPQPNPFNAPQPIQPWQLDPRQPLMSYTRIFDGAEGELVAALRDYVELTGDLRSGGWEEYLHRSDDFIRFCSYRMIQEMLSLHGGEGKHRLILKWRKYR